ncbi:MAG: acetyl-CoA carboxylase carboxyltransferase subunit beta [Planctomycetes bacterium]|nr:acetyl-CoA carboxylase carboxyltransferase subunit beta [Planctomycetota bacterium]
MAWDGLKKFVFRRKRDLPEGLWMRCDDCGALIYKKVVEERNNTCPECNYHFPMTAPERIQLLLDPGSFHELWEDLTPVDPLGFVGVNVYRDRLAETQIQTGLRDAAIVGVGTIQSKPLVFGVTDSRFIMGSMGSVVGEKIARGAELAAQEKLPYVVISGSGGGARMYEGCLSLMQMAKTSAAIARLHDAGGVFVSVLTHPTMAGVMASFAALGHIVIAEPKALIGFTGPRVIEQTIKQELPKGFQRAEFMLDHGFVDLIVARQELRETLARILGYIPGRVASGIHPALSPA